MNFNIFKIETTCKHVLFILTVSSHTISKYYAKDNHYFFQVFFPPVRHLNTLNDDSWLYNNDGFMALKNCLSTMVCGFIMKLHYV